jgi:hypothetical protein
MSLDVSLMDDQGREIYSENITHNLAKMGREAGIYEALWRPEKIGAKKAEDIVRPLRIGLTALKEAPDYFRKFNPPNGWGTYENLALFVARYIEACEDNPEATIEVSR